MNTLLIFVWVYLAMIATSFWESAVEGRNAWHKGKHGWKVRLGSYVILNSYHFFLFVVMWPLLLTLPFVVYGWNLELFGILASAYFSGLVLEDLMWFIVNPVVKFSELNPKFANYYPWIIIGRFRLPLFYVLSLVLAFLSWLFLWG